MPDFAMPRLSDTMEEGTIVAWLKVAGDDVREGEDLVEIETDKATMTCPSDFSGVLTIYAGEGDTLPVGQPIGAIGEPGAGAAAVADGASANGPAASDRTAGEATAGDARATTGDDTAIVGDVAAPASAPAGAGAAGSASAAVLDDASASATNGAAPKATPVARRMARRLDLDLVAIRGSGPHGRIVKADVEAAAQAPEPAPAAAAAPADGGGDARGSVDRRTPTRLQAVVARRMVESKTAAPEFFLTVEVDMTDAVALRAQMKAAAGDGVVVPSFNDLVVRACALALAEFPQANGAWVDGGFEHYSRVNVGVAVAADDALLVPTVLDADRKSLGTIARETRALAEAVRQGGATPAQLSGGTFTVSNLGMFGIDRFTAVLNPPQAAILAVGRMDDKPVWRDDAFVRRSIMALTLTCDHRILYGADAARFLARIRERLETPILLAM